MEKNTYKILEAHRKVMIFWWILVGLSVVICIGLLLTEISWITLVASMLTAYFWAVVGFYSESKKEEIENDGRFL